MTLSKAATRAETVGGGAEPPRAYPDADDVHAGRQVAVLSHGVLVLGDHHHVHQACQVVVVPHCCRVHTPAQEEGWEAVLNVNCLITVVVNLSPMSPHNSTSSLEQTSAL